MSENNIYLLELAIIAAIEEVGIELFKSTSLFGSIL